MLQRIRIHRSHGRLKHCYACIGDTLYKPKVLPAGSPDIRLEHLSFLCGTAPITTAEKLIHAILVHENTHSERQIKFGVWWLWLWQLRYIFSKSFRLNEEKAAYEAQIVQLVRHEFRVRSIEIAEAMSGTVYRNMVTFEEALSWVRDTVRKAEIEYFVDVMNTDLQSDDTINSVHKMPEPPGTIGVIKDRIALVFSAMVAYVFTFSLVFGLVLILRTAGAK